MSLDWVCSIGSLGVAYLFARGLRRAGLWASLVMQLPWALLGYADGRWGIVALSVAFVGIDIYGLQRKSPCNTGKN